MDRASAAKNRHTWINCTVSAKRQGSGTSIGEKTQLWDDEAHIYTNLFANGTFLPPHLTHQLLLHDGRGHGGRMAD